jgi:hypothetical protein
LRNPGEPIMSLASTTTDIEYPESDGMPMGETDLHIEWMFRLRALMRYRYRGQWAYVASNLLLYYEQGNPLLSPRMYLLCSTMIPGRD